MLPVHTYMCKYSRTGDNFWDETASSILQYWGAIEYIWNFSNFNGEEYKEVIHYIEFQLVKGASDT